MNGVARGVSRTGEIMALNALFVGSSGLTTYSAALDVVGNNLANINTTGYKTQRMLFKDIVYQTLNAGSAATATIGGTNPIQLGFGVGTASIDSLFQQGALNPTGRSLDVGIQGTGFFVLSDGTQNFYTRAGSFNVDANGFLVDPGTGLFVQRFGTVGEATATTPGFQVAGSQNILVPLGAGIAGTPTTQVNYQGNLSSTIPVGQSATAGIQIFDSQSTQRALAVTFTKTGPNTFTTTASIGGGTATIAAPTVTFNNNGLLASPAALSVAITGIPGVADQTVTLNLGTPGQSTGVTQFGGTTTVTAVTQDGTGSGTLTDVAFDNAGLVQGSFSNGRTVPIAQLAMANFSNQGGLIRVGQNFFMASASSGGALVGVAGQGGVGTLQGATLEAANVDIAIEFSRLIIAQRGFQVNAQTVTAANETLQELGNIIR